jgi:curved DNA-binding protein CbpA
MTAPTAVERGPVRLLAETAGAGATGILSASRGKHKRLICFEQGQVVFVASNLIEEQLDETLVQNRVLAPIHRAEAKAAAQREEKKITAVLLERNFVQPSALRQAMEQHFTELLRSTLEWPDGEFSFEAGRPDLDGEITARLSCVPLILAHVARHPATVDDVRMRIGPPNMRPVVTARAAATVEQVSLGDVARSLLDACDGSRDVSKLLEQSRYSAEDLLRALYGLLLLGIVEPARKEKAAKARVMDQVGREEALARLHQAQGADHYLVLGVDSRAEEQKIRAAYYQLARRFHPDRFSTGPLADLRPKIEAFFTQVTEAYNTLSDKERRRQYDQEQLEAAAKKTKEPAQDTAYLARENFARARILLDKGRFQDAVVFLENAIQLDDTKADYHLELGRVLIRNPRRRKDAEQHLRRAVELDPTSVPGFVALGQICRKMGRDDDARDAFNEALRWEPSNVEALDELKQMG